MSALVLRWRGPQGILGQVDGASMEQLAGFIVPPAAPLPPVQEAADAAAQSAADAANEADAAGVARLGAEQAQGAAQGHAAAAAQSALASAQDVIASAASASAASGHAAAAAASETAAAGHAADAQGAAVAAAVDAVAAVQSDLEDEVAAGQAAAAAVATNGAVAQAAINSAGAAQLAAVTSAGAGSLPTLTDNTLTLRHQTIGGSIQTNLGQNIGVHQFALVTGTHLQAGDDVAAMRFTWAAASDTARVEIMVYERDVAAATTAGTINTGGVVAQDALIRTFNTTPAALGVTPGTNNAIVTRAYLLPTPITVRAGFDLVFFIRNFNASNALVNCAFNTLIAAAGSQRRAGFQATTASPNTFSAIIGGTARTAVVSILGRRLPLAQAEAAAALKLLADQSDEQTLLAMNQRNWANLFSARAVHLATAYTLSVPLSFWGDSLVEDATIAAPAYRAVTTAANILSGTVNNNGIGGQTSTQVTARVVAATAGEKAGINYVKFGANDNIATVSAATILSNFATCVAQFTSTNYVVASTWAAGAIRARDRDVMRSLRLAYGVRALDWGHVWARYAAGSGDAATSRQNAVATGFLIDTIHTNRAGCIIKGYEFAALALALNGGAPYVHDDIIGIKNGDAAGAAIITPRALGETLNWSIIGGNDDDAIQINRSTGAITRTANPVLAPYREAFVEAENHRGKGRNGRIIIVRQMEGTNPQAGVEVRGNGASYGVMPTSYAPADGTGMTVVVCARLNLDRISGSLITSAAGSAILAQNQAGLQFTPRNAAGGLLGNITLFATQPGDWNFYFYSIDTAATVRGSMNEATSSASPTAGNIGHSTFTQYFTNNSNSAPFIGGLKMLAVYNQYFDVHDSAVRALLYDSVTRLPKDIGDGTAGGALAAPAVYLRGMAGDYLLGKNFGTGGDLHVPVPLGRRHVGFTDIAL